MATPAAALDPRTHHEEAARLRLKTRLFTVLVVCSNLAGNYSLAWGARRLGRILATSPLTYLEALFNPFIGVGVALLIVWMLSRMALFSWADLSYVLPVTSIGYVLTALAGRFFMGEHVSSMQWSGILLITGGVALAGNTHPNARNGRHGGRKAGEQ